MKTIDLGALSFGAPAAERDRNLQDYFIERESFARLRDGRKTVALGNRGAGKTAVSKMLAENAKSNEMGVIELSPENYSYELLSESLVKESSGSWYKQGAYTAAWKYVLLVLVMKKVTEPVGYQTIAQAETSYSEMRLKDIAAEYRFEYPGLEYVFQTFRGIQYNFDRDGLEWHCLLISTGEFDVGIASEWCKGMDSDALIQVLWQVGFLRAQAVGAVRAKQRSGSSYLGPHQISTLTLANLNRFHVHQMFRTYLGMKEGTYTIR